MTQPAPWQLTPPADDGDALLWPAPRTWLELAEQTHRDLADAADVRLLDLPLPEIRRMARQSFPAFTTPPIDAEKLWLVTGHQTFPYHPGVWAKTVAIDSAARHGGIAVNLNVDHDLPHAGPQISWPAMADSRLVRHGNLELDHRQPFERQPAPTTATIALLCQRIAAELDPLLIEQRACPFDLSAGPGNADGNIDPASFGGWFALARSELDRRLGLRVVEAMTSALCRQDAFLLFAADAVARAGSLAKSYNDAIEHCRTVTGRSPATPLATDDGQIELPFWTLRPGTPGRGRLRVSPEQDNITIGDDRGPIGQLAQADLRTVDVAIDRLRTLLAGHGVELRPRALTLTLFTRLTLADLFVHGVGGAAYEQATDYLIRHEYGLAPPPFAVASATMFLHLSATSATAEQYRAARHQLRDLACNPQRHLPAEVLAEPSAKAQVAEKWAAVERNDLLRRGERSSASHAERHDLFARIRQVNAQLARLLGDRVSAQSDLVDLLARQEQAGRLLSSREFFYGLFPTTRLTRLAETIRGQFGR